MKRDRQNWVFGFLARWILLLNALELTLSENGVRAEHFQNFFLVEQKLLTSRVRHAPRGLGVMEFHDRIPRNALIGFVHFFFLSLGNFDQGRDVFVEFQQAALTARPFGEAESLPIILTRHIGRPTSSSPIGRSQIHLLLQVFVRTFDLLVFRLIKPCLGLIFIDLLLKVLDGCLGRILVIFLLDQV